MVGKGRGSHGLICVETPAVLLVFLNHLCNLLMMPDLHTLPFFQSNNHLLYPSDVHMQAVIIGSIDT